MARIPVRVLGMRGADVAAGYPLGPPCSVSLAGRHRFTDPERARLLHQYALRRANADAQRLVADIQRA